jgi:hypothetical protein
VRFSAVEASGFTYFNAAAWGCSESGSCGRFFYGADLLVVRPGDVVYAVATSFADGVVFIGLVQSMHGIQLSVFLFKFQTCLSLCI